MGAVKTEHFVTVVQVGGGGCALRPPIKTDPSEPDWELDHACETVGTSPGGAVVLVTAYWKRPEPETPERSPCLVRQLAQKKESPPCP